MNHRPTITTITCIVDLDFTIELRNLVYFLPTNKGLKRIEDGDLILVKFSDYAKGLLSCNKKRPFRNSITLSMVFEKKIVGVKIFRNKLQICGINSDRAIDFCVQRILKHLTNIQRLSPCLNVYTLSFINNFPEKHENVFQKLKEMRHVISGSIGYRVNKVMINYKFDLEYNISKLRVLKIFQRSENGRFLVSYQNTSDFNVYVIYRDEDGGFVCYVMIYRSGLITQSGKDQQKMDKALKELIEILEQNKKDIFMQTKRRVVYRKC